MIDGVVIVVEYCVIPLIVVIILLFNRTICVILDVAKVFLISGGVGSDVIGRRNPCIADRVNLALKLEIVNPVLH